MSGMMGPPGMGMMGAPPMVPNPAFAEWMKQAQAVVAANEENQKRQAQFDAACALIRQDGVTAFKLDIEADSTIAPDEQAEKQSRTEFLAQFIPLVQTVAPIARGNPQMAELVSQIAMFAVRAFRVARPLEDAIESAFATLGKMPPEQPKGSGPAADPALEQAKIAADVQDTALKAQTDQAAIAQKAQEAQQQAQIAWEKLRSENQHNQARLAIDAAKLQSDERIAAAKVLSMGSRSAEGLT